MATTSTGVDFGVATAPQIWAVWIGPQRNGNQLHDLIFIEARPDLGEMATHLVRPVMEIPAQATDVLCPWTTFDRSEATVIWRAWREGKFLCALSSGGTLPQRQDLAAPPDAVLRPALMSNKSELDIFVLSGALRQLSLFRFIPPSPQRLATQSVLWRFALPEAAINGRVAMGTAEHGSHRRIVLLAQEAGRPNRPPQLLVMHADAGDGGSAPRGVTVSHIPEAITMPNSEPGVYVDTAGVTHTSILFRRDIENPAFFLADLAFGPDGKAIGEPLVESLGVLPTPATSAAVSFLAEPGRPMRRDWVVILQDGSVMHSQIPGRPMKTRGIPVEPPDLVVLRQTTYLLTQPQTSRQGMPDAGPKAPLLEPLI